MSWLDQLFETGLKRLANTGTWMTVRPTLNFVNATVVDDSTNNQTTVTIPSGVSTWGADLATATSTTQWVSAISGGGGTGGAVPLNAVKLQWSAASTTAGLYHTQAVAGAGTDMVLRSQAAASGSAAIGGSIRLTLGAPDGAGSYGSILFMTRAAGGSDTTFLSWSVLAVTPHTDLTGYTLGSSSARFAAAYVAQYQILPADGDAVGTQTQQIRRHVLNVSTTDNTPSTHSIAIPDGTTATIEIVWSARNTTAPITRAGGGRISAAVYRAGESVSLAGGASISTWAAITGGGTPDFYPPAITGGGSNVASVIVQQGSAGWSADWQLDVTLTIN